MANLSSEEMHKSKNEAAFWQPRGSCDDGKADTEGDGALLLLCLDRAVMAVDNAVGNRQSQTVAAGSGARLVCTVEPIENVCQILFL